MASSITQVDITSKSSMELSDDLMKMMSPALDAIRSSLRDQTKIMSDTFNLGIENARKAGLKANLAQSKPCLLYTSPSPRDRTRSRMPSSA